MISVVQSSLVFVVDEIKEKYPVNDRLLMTTCTLSVGRVCCVSGGDVLLTA